jgi:hypothetical protein
VTTPTRARDLVGYALATALVAWLAVRRWYGDLPTVHWVVPLSLLLLALAEVLAANNLRARIRRRPGFAPVEPLVAARSLALAKASADVGAVVAGAWAGLLVYTAPRLDQLAAAAGDARTATAGLLSAAALVAAALYLEHSCRAPAPPDGDPRTGPNGGYQP